MWARISVLVVCVACGRIGYHPVDASRVADTRGADTSADGATVFDSRADATSADASGDVAFGDVAADGAPRDAGDGGGADIVDSDASSLDGTVADSRAADTDGSFVDTVSPLDSPPPDSSDAVTDANADTSDGACGCPFGCDPVGRCRAGGILLDAWRYGGTDLDSVTAAAVDPSGNLWLSGEYWGGAPSFGGAALHVVTGGFLEITTYLASYRPDGTHRFSKDFWAPDPASFGIATIEATPTGDVWIAGTYSGNANTIDAMTLPPPGAGAPLYIAKLDASGVAFRTRGFNTGTATVYVTDARVTPTNDLLVYGFFNNGSINIGGSLLSTAGLNEDPFLGWYTDATAHVLSYRLGGTGVDYAATVDVHPTGEHWIAGSFRGGLRLGAANYTPMGIRDAFVARLDTGGNVLWSDVVRGSGIEDIACMVIDPAGDVWVVGEFDTNANIFGVAMPLVGAFDVFVAKLNASGAVRFVRAYGGSGSIRAGHCNTDDSGNLWTSFSLDGAVDFGGGTVMSAAGGRDNVVVGFAPDGSHRRTIQFGSPNDDFGTTLVVAGPGGILWVATVLQGPTNYGTGMLAPSGPSDVVVLRYQD